MDQRTGRESAQGRPVRGEGINHGLRCSQPRGPCPKGSEWIRFSWALALLGLGPQTKPDLQPSQWSFCAGRGPWRPIVAFSKRPLAAPWPLAALAKLGFGIIWHWAPAARRPLLLCRPGPLFVDRSRAL